MATAAGRGRRTISIIGWHGVVEDGMSDGTIRRQFVLTKLLAPRLAI